MEYLHGITVQKILIYNQYQNAIKKQFNQLMEYNSQENKENKFYNAVINKFNLYSRCFLNINIYDFLEIVTIRDLIYLLKEENIEIDFNTHKVFTKPEHFQTAVKVLLNPELNKYQYDYKPEVIQSYIRNTLKKLEKD